MRFHAILYAIPLALLAQAAAAQCTHDGIRAKTEWNMGYNAAVPLGEMGRYASTVHSFNFGGYYRVPASAGAVDVGFDVATGNYASFTRTQMFGMNGVETPVEVHYNSAVTNTSAVLRYNYLRTNSMVLFTSVKGGFAGFSSKIMIEDPNDPDGCKPMDENKLISDYNWTAGLRTGANIDMHAFIKRMPVQTFWFQTYAGYIQGGNVDYINIKNTTTDEPGHNHATSTADGGRPLDVRFVNLQTGTEHTHEVARIYTTPVQFMEFGVSFVMRL